jgi:predicted Zn-dependent protease
MEPGFDRALEYYLGRKKLFRRSFFDKIGITGCLLAILLVILPLLAAFFWLAPFIAERAADNISPETEQQIGASWYQSLTANYTIDSAKTRQAQQFYDSLRYGGNYPFHITVVQEPVVNAFAVPGGHIVVFDSIIGIMDAPEQLAGLLAHEASHIQLKHSTRAIFRQLSNQLLISLVFGDYGSVSGIVAQHSSQLAGLSYSRSLEMEADQHGLELMDKRGIPLRGMPDLFRKMKASASGQPSEAPNFMSTHPGLNERIASTEKRIQQNKRQGDTLPPALLEIWKALKQ